MFFSWVCVLATVTALDFGVNEKPTVPASTAAWITMSNKHLYEKFDRLIAEQRPSHIRVSGRHNVQIPDSSSVEEVVDFDLKADASGFIELSVIEITSSANLDEVHILAAGNGEDSEEILVREAVNMLENIAASENDRIILMNQVTNQDAMALSLQRSADNARYGGRVHFELENAVEISPDQTTQKPVYNGHWIQASVAWKYKSWYKPKVAGQTRRTLASGPIISNGSRPMTWNIRIQHAMIDEHHGLINLEDAFDQTVPMMKAVRKFALYEPLTMQGIFGTSRIHKWGLDEPNDELPYVGSSHFGRRMQPAAGNT